MGEYQSSRKRYFYADIKYTSWLTDSFQVEDNNVYKSIISASFRGAWGISS